MRRTVGAAILLASVASGLAATQDTAPVERALLVVLDVSGSMNESVEGGVKRDLARRGLLRTLETIPAGTVAGLRLLGQGSSANQCTASDSAVAFAPVVIAQWEAALGAVRWKGSTPLVFSMRRALADLRAVSATRREMLIVGDGGESCGEDPVGVARAEAGDIRIHTISLGEAVSHTLAGIALVTNGTYARAFDDTTFAEAATAAVPGPPPTAPGPEAGAGRLEVILDVSNSMWGQIGSRPKIELAREAIGRALAGISADIPVGLRAYGHRVDVQDRTGGCTDTERLIAAAPGNATAVAARVQSLTPRGQTPIARSLEQAGADLRAEGGSAVVLLVTDGVESCGGDPAAVIASLRAAGLSIVLHTVGLGVAPDEARVLAALAGAGGGTYVSAANVDDLRQGVEAAARSSAGFVLTQESVTRFPADVARVRGGATVASAEMLEPGTFSFVDHLFGEQRYFVVRGTPGRTVTLRGMVSALAAGRTRNGVVNYQDRPSLMVGERVDADGRRPRGANLLVRGDMGTWHELTMPIGTDGLVRFRLGQVLGSVHRDMIFSVAR
jgi:hypothetical protein